MREIHVSQIIKEVKEMCIEANLSLTKDVGDRIRCAAKSETGTVAKKILEQLVENMEIAAAEQIPICQDTGMAVTFMEIGQDVHIDGDLNEAVNEGVKNGYVNGYLRKSVVEDPLLRKNTGDNTPADIVLRLVPGDQPQGRL